MTEPMGWSCWACGTEFPHARHLVNHLRGEHPEHDPTAEPAR